jgi:small subunit ribosomal protein S13
MSFLKKKIFNKSNILQNLRSIYGIGNNTAIEICKNIGIQPALKFKLLREDQLYKLLNYIEQNYFLIENNLKFFQKENNSYLGKVRNFRYIRNKAGFPTRGQRTHTNANTKKKLKNG